MSLPAGPSAGHVRLGRILLLAFALLLGGCRVAGPPLPPAPAPAEGWSEVGEASWYGHPFHGRTTASGEVYDMEDMTAAHQTLPFGTVLQVENLDNGLSTTVRINDRGPFARGRVLDLSRRAAREIEMMGPGIAQVRITVLEAPEPNRCWWVQAGSFEQEANARELERRLAGGSHPVDVDRTESGIFRVRVGPIVDEGEARAVARETGGLSLMC